MDREEELSKEIERLNRRLAQTEGELEDFLYAVSHDLKAPLRAIMSTSMIVVEDYGDRLGAEGVGELERGARAAKKIADLVEHILKLSRLNREALEPAVVDVSKLATEVVSRTTMDSLPGACCEIQPGMSAFADPRLLQMILACLVDNALKFSLDSQSLSIRIGKEDGAFFVADNGIGFKPEQAQRMFRPFERLNGDEYSGDGVGLATARLLVNKHGGRIWAEGESGKGATIRFELPDGP